MQRLLAVARTVERRKSYSSTTRGTSTPRGQVEIDEKVEELIFLTTALLAGSGKPGSKPRLDFFLMHLVTASVFLPIPPERAVERGAQGAAAEGNRTIASSVQH